MKCGFKGNLKQRLNEKVINNRVGILPITEICKKTQNYEEKVKSIGNVGLDLRRTHGKLLLIVPINNDGKTKLAQCLECHKLQRLCSESNMRKILSKHPTERTPQEEFQNFLIKSLTSPSRQFKRIFNKIFDEVGDEMGFDGKQMQLDGDDEKNSYVNEVICTLSPKSIPRSLSSFDEIGINFCIQVSNILCNSELRNALKKFTIKKNDVTVQAVFNCSVEMQTLDDFWNGTVTLRQTGDSQSKSSPSDDSGSSYADEKVESWEPNIQLMGTNEYTEIN